MVKSNVVTRIRALQIFFLLILIVTGIIVYIKSRGQPIIPLAIGGIFPFSIIYLLLKGIKKYELTDEGILIMTYADISPTIIKYNEIEYVVPILEFGPEDIVNKTIVVKLIQPKCHIFQIGSQADKFMDEFVKRKVKHITAEEFARELKKDQKKDNLRISKKIWGWG